MMSENTSQSIIKSPDSPSSETSNITRTNIIPSIDLSSDEKTMVILRGISGSGKSTLASMLLDQCSDSVHLTTDDYFVRNGRYMFYGSKLPYAHQWNKDRATRALKKGKKLIIIDNTHTQKWEAKPYVEEAMKYEYKVIFLEPNTPWKFNANELANKNKHGVPIEKIREMINRYEDDFTVESVLASSGKRGGFTFKPFDMVQVILTKESVQELLKHVENRYDKLFASHVTLAFKPDISFFQTLKENHILEKDFVKIQTDLLVWSDSMGVETLRVTEMKTDHDDEVICQNEVPHITISINPKIAQAVQSNELLKMTKDDIKTKGVSLSLEGHVAFIRFPHSRN